MQALPSGFAAHVAGIGVKDDSDDFLVIVSDRPAATAGVFTQSRFVGPSVTISRANVASGEASAMVVVSKNANVANGAIGEADARELVELVAARVGVAPTDVLVASTGVIGRPYPMDRIRAGIADIPTPVRGGDAEAAARAMMTTDTVPKVATANVDGSSASVVGIAKGVGMIEPDMATMIAIVLTDAEVGSADLDVAWRRAVDGSFNCLSVDTDTSTSDTAVVMASGEAGPVDPEAFDAALSAVCVDLTRQLARDGEGAETLIEVEVTGARDPSQAKRVAKAIVNSPLVKTAVHGADPNWGRVAMAIGKCTDDVDIDQTRVVIRFGETEVYPEQVDGETLVALEEYLRGDTVRIGVDLEIGEGSATVWGCDLTDGYVRINADYTT